MDTRDKSTEKLTQRHQLEAQADIVRGLILQGAYDIAKQFIDFIASKTKAEMESSKVEKPKEED